MGMLFGKINAKDLLGGLGDSIPCHEMVFHSWVHTLLKMRFHEYCSKEFEFQRYSGMKNMILFVDRSTFLYYPGLVIYFF